MQFSDERLFLCGQRKDCNFDSPLTGQMFRRQFREWLFQLLKEKTLSKTACLVTLGGVYTNCFPCTVISCSRCVLLDIFFVLYIHCAWQIAQEWNVLTMNPLATVWILLSADSFIYNLYCQQIYKREAHKNVLQYPISF